MGGGNKEQPHLRGNSGVHKGRRSGMKKLSQKRIDVYDIGDGLTLMNVINKNENGKMHQITTYIGIDSVTSLM